MNKLTTYPDVPHLDALGARTDWVRLRTVVTLRWLAIAGQVAGVLGASVIYDLVLPMGLVSAVVAVAVLANLVLMAAPESRRLSEGEALGVIAFDTAQLGALLALTGGLNNPFALLILAPVTIAATLMSLGRTLALGLVAVAMATALGLWHEPLRTAEGAVLEMAPMFVTGFWVAILTGVMFLGFYARRVTTEMQAMSEALLAAQMALAREQKLTDLGGVVAAAAHELNTPLATIKLVATELSSELEEPHLREDAELIAGQADRCRDILRSMGRAGKDDRHMRRAPLGAVLREAAEPHQGRGARINFHLAPMGGSPESEDDPRQPLILRSPELIHGLRNLIQNAVDFARSSVWVEARWSSTEIALTITDDGPGYPPTLLRRIGDPFMGRAAAGRRRGYGRARARAVETADGASAVEAEPRPRSGYEGMGLGLFIAKTLLERSGARIEFSNAGDPFGPQGRTAPRLGARVALRWPRARLDATDRGGALGKNLPFLP